MGQLHLAELKPSLSEVEKQITKKQIWGLRQGLEFAHSGTEHSSES